MTRPTCLQSYTDECTCCAQSYARSTWPDGWLNIVFCKWFGWQIEIDRPQDFEILTRREEK
jgi:hypothetical protein